MQKGIKYANNEDKNKANKEAEILRQSPKDIFNYGHVCILV